jgi:prevent-host-death family protein
MGEALRAQRNGPESRSGTGAGAAATGTGATGTGATVRRIGIRELRQHASIYVDLAEKGYTVDITNRGRPVAQLVPFRQPDSPLERWIVAGILQEAEEDGDILDIEPAPAVPPGQPTASEILTYMREEERY